MTLDDLFDQLGFTPNSEQRRAVLHMGSPLFLIAGPGSGKTRVLLWRVVNLVVFQGVEPREIFLSTFTEKAAKQLNDGLQTILGHATNQTGHPYDLAQMYVGTVHSLCQRMLSDRRFAKDRTRPKVPRLLDEIEQYFLLNHRNYWNELERRSGLGEGPNQTECWTLFWNRCFKAHFCSIHDQFV